MVGRVVNTLGFPIDGKGPIGGDLYEMPLERKAPLSYLPSASY
jgi:F-type H+-transporting ATPase subunit alpha